MKNKITLILSLFSVLYGTLTLQSCGKEKESFSDIEVVGDGDELIINNALMSEYTPQLDLQASRNLEKNSRWATSDNDLIAEVNERGEIKSQLKAETGETTTTKISPWVAFKVVLLNADNEYVDEALGRYYPPTGSSVKFKVKIKPGYRVVAYTYNIEDSQIFNSQGKPTINDSLYSHQLGSLENRNTIGKPWIIPNREFYYASSPIVVDEKTGAKKIDLKFRPIVARIGINLDVRGIFAKISGSIKMVSMSNNFLKAGRFNLLTGKYDVVGTEGSFRRITPEGEIDRTTIEMEYSRYLGRLNEVDEQVKGYFYALVDSDGKIVESESDQYVRVGFVGATVVSSLKGKQIVYKEIDGSNQLTDDLSYAFTLNGGFTGLANGKSKVFNFQVFRGFKVGNLLWSTTNLAYNATTGYLLRKDASRLVEEEDFWKYFSETPNGNDGIKDPCTNLPFGNWKMPSLADYQELSKLNYSNGNNYSAITGNSSIKFYYFGKILITGYKAHSNSQAIYWFNNNEGMTGTKKYYYFTSGKNGDISVGVSQDERANVRCVREIS